MWGFLKLISVMCSIMVGLNFSPEYLAVNLEL